MKKRLTVNLIFFNGHIEIVVEDPTALTIIHTRTPGISSSIKRVKNDHEHIGYQWDGSKLMQLFPDESPKEVRINDIDLFKKNLSDLSSDVNAIDLYLNSEQADTLITQNGGHVVENYLPTFYIIDRWSGPRSFGEAHTFSPEHIFIHGKNGDIIKSRRSGSSAASMRAATDCYRFDIEADPKEIQQQWLQYYDATEDKEHIFGENCAAAAQWFLTTFVQLSKPRFWAAPFTTDQIAPYLYLPSIIPLPVEIPKRVFENAKYELSIRRDPHLFTQETYLKLNIDLARTALICFGSCFAIVLALRLLTQGQNVVTVPVLSYAVAQTTPRFFAAFNARMAKNIANEQLTTHEKDNADITNTDDHKHAK